MPEHSHMRNFTPHNLQVSTKNRRPACNEVSPAAMHQVVAGGLPGEPLASKSIFYLSLGLATLVTLQQVTDTTACTAGPRTSTVQIIKTLSPQPAPSRRTLKT